MDFDAIFVILFVAGIIGGFFVVFIYPYFLQQYDIQGQVSSLKYVDWIVLKYNCVEFYGGAQTCFWAGYNTSGVEANKVCKVNTKGYYLTKLECKQ